MIESIQRQVIRGERDRTLPAVVRARQGVVALDLHTLRHATIELKDQRVVLGKYVAANLSDLSVERIWSRGRKSSPLTSAEENRHADNLSIRGSSHCRHVHKLQVWCAGSRQISIDEVWEILAIAKKIRS